MDHFHNIFIVHILLVLFLINLSIIFSYYYLWRSYLFKFKKRFFKSQEISLHQNIITKKKKTELIKKNYFIFKWFNKKWNSIHGLKFYMGSQREIQMSIWLLNLLHKNENNWITIVIVTNVLHLSLYTNILSILY